MDKTRTALRNWKQGAIPVEMASAYLRGLSGAMGGACIDRPTCWKQMEEWNMSGQNNGSPVTQQQWKAPDDFCLEGQSYELDDSRRIALKNALWEHALEALAYSEKTGKEKPAEFLRWEMDQLRPYWQKPGVTKEDAIIEFIENNGF